MGKKHKKKVYNTPKKVKHVHKNVDINKLIGSLDNPRCNVCQSILAIHTNRKYCGKCNVSITQ